MKRQSIKSKKVILPQNYKYKEIRRNIDIWTKKKQKLKIPRQEYYGGLFELREREMLEYSKLNPSPLLVKSRNPISVPDFRHVRTAEEIDEVMKRKKYDIKLFIEHKQFSNEEVRGIIKELYSNALKRLKEVSR